MVGAVVVISGRMHFLARREVSRKPPSLALGTLIDDQQIKLRLIDVCSRAWGVQKPRPDKICFARDPFTPPPGGAIYFPYVERETSGGGDCRWWPSHPEK
ncbi:hypothetical protein TNIN_386591 [Trichonephila inaurata madagascariensis]|uniref:Uncharacterized protein n=1 Tax=Trichonephila inaurata madagascariensis TaxID=2747483 RepID=A0A8X7C258_9ARAC|nr:hypothetical protein TNIN_386591 [Trichonephila inaurata madagascariensis]